MPASTRRKASASTLSSPSVQDREPQQPFDADTSDLRDDSKGAPPAARKNDSESTEGLSASSTRDHHHGVTHQKGLDSPSLGGDGGTAASGTSSSRSLQSGNRHARDQASSPAGTSESPHRAQAHLFSPPTHKVRY
jgi:hypothetical protein